MKGKKETTRVVAFLFLLTAIAALIWLSNRRDRDRSSEGRVAEPGNKSNTSIHSRITNPTRETPPGTGGTAIEDEYTPDRSHTSIAESERVVLEQIDSLLALALGRVTGSQAQDRIKTILEEPESIAVLKAQLLDGQLPHKLLAVYALIEANQFTADVEKLVLADPSPYIRAEAVHYLLRKGQFEQVDTLIRASVELLDWSQVSELLNFVAGKPNPDLPVALTRLGLGEGLPLYLDLLAERSATLRLAAFTRLDDPHAARKTKSLMLTLVDSTADAELVERLKLDFVDETNTAVRIRLAQYIAARSSKQNAEVVAFLESALPSTPAGVGPVELRYREDRIEALRAHEQVMEQFTLSDDFDPVALNGALGAYLNEGEMVGFSLLSKEALISIPGFLRSKGYVYAPDIIARAEYLASRIK